MDKYTWKHGFRSRRELNANTGDINRIIENHTKDTKGAETEIIEYASDAVDAINHREQFAVDKADKIAVVDNLLRQAITKSEDEYNRAEQEIQKVLANKNQSERGKLASWIKHQRTEFDKLRK